MCVCMHTCISTPPHTSSFVCRPLRSPSRRQRSTAARTRASWCRYGREKRLKLLLRNQYIGAFQTNTATIAPRVNPLWCRYGRATWPLQDIVLLRGFSARTSRPFTPPPPALSTWLHDYYTTNAQYTTPSSDLPFVCHTPYILAIAISCKSRRATRSNLLFQTQYIGALQWTR